jgi:uncharacterized protein (TIGR02646 family)
MRPIGRGLSPIATDYADYAKAKAYLVSRMGMYCSYCERHGRTDLAVEHVQPKALAKYSHLEGSWTNFLLACRNCNGTKKDQDVVLAEILLPDRDNTFAAYVYSADGKIAVSPGLMQVQQEMAERTLRLTGLEKPLQVYLDANGQMVALDRVSQRMQVWGIAESAKADLLNEPRSEGVKRGVIRTATAEGHFCVWMTVFTGDVEMRNRLIDAFTGTRESGCFDAVTAVVVRPAPNPDGLPAGGKV